jgi:glycine/D-amino acid oxidase-like deaminating enzyme
LKNALFALGFGGNGITFSAIATELIAAELAGKPHESAKLYGFNR